MKLDISLPLVDIHGDPATVREFAQTAEGIGYHHLAAPDARRTSSSQPRS